MNDHFEYTKNLTDELLEHRQTNAEAELAVAFRALKPNEKLKIVETLLLKNVRLAASISAKGDLPKATQEQLLEQMIISNQTNALKTFISACFVHRIGLDTIIFILDRLKHSHPKGVNFATFYLIGNTSDPFYRARLKLLLAETKPKTRE